MHHLECLVPTGTRFTVKPYPGSDPQLLSLRGEKVDETHLKHTGIILNDSGERPGSHPLVNHNAFNLGRGPRYQIRDRRDRGLILVPQRKMKHIVPVVY